MGMYDSYGEHQIQLKNGPCVLNHYHIGDKCELEDGVYMGFDGVVVILIGRLAYTSMGYTDKWGRYHSVEGEMLGEHPLVKAIKKLRSKHDRVRSSTKDSNVRLAGKRARRSGNTRKSGRKSAKAIQARRAVDRG